MQMTMDGDYLEESLSTPSAPGPRSSLGEQSSRAKSKHTSTSCRDAVGRLSVACGGDQASL